MELATSLQRAQMALHHLRRRRVRVLSLQQTLEQRDDVLAHDVRLHAVVSGDLCDGFAIAAQLGQPAPRQ